MSVQNPIDNPPYEAGDLSASREGGVDLQKLDAIFAAIRNEVIRASGLHAPMHSHHEAYGVIAEEFEEFWEDVRRDDVPGARKELVQLAAMAVRALHDVTETRAAKPGPLDKRELRRVRWMLAEMEKAANEDRTREAEAREFLAL